MNEDVAHETTQETSSNTDFVPRETLCACGAKARDGQRNCLKCHRDANTIYRAKQRAELKELRSLKQRIILQSIIDKNNEARP